MRSSAADRVAHPEPDHEPVELALGQDVGPLELVGVLRRQHDERRVERIGLALDRDLAVAHRLEQGALGPRGGPVDLVGQDHVGEERAGLEDELAAGRVVDARAEDVRGEQVGSELDSPERAVDAGRQGPGQQGLAHARHVLDQHVPLGQEGDDGELDDLAACRGRPGRRCPGAGSRDSASRRGSRWRRSIVWGEFMRYAQAGVQRPWSRIEEGDSINHEASIPTPA